MIIEKGEHKYRDIVTRVCDNCNRQDRRTFGSIEDARKNRKTKGSQNDYCKKCSYIYRDLSHPSMEKSYSWNGGRYLNENGYYRVYSGNQKYEYEHKVLFEKYIKRKISQNEKVHHIDLNKINNSIGNLYLCKNKSEHWICHQSMEDIGFILFGKQIFYDYVNYIYSLTPQKQQINLYNISGSRLQEINGINGIKTYKESRRNSSRFYLKPTNQRMYGKRHIHTLLAEVAIGRKLFIDEIVHHINGNTLDNSMENLQVMSRSKHKKCHYSLQSCVAALFVGGKVKFYNGKYYIGG